MICQRCAGSLLVRVISTREGSPAADDWLPLYMRPAHAPVVTLRALRATLPLLQQAMRLIMHGDAVTVLHLILAPREYPGRRLPATARSYPDIACSIFPMQSNVALGQGTATSARPRSLKIIYGTAFWCCVEA